MMRAVVVWDGRLRDTERLRRRRGAVAIPIARDHRRGGRGRGRRRDHGQPAAVAVVLGRVGVVAGRRVVPAVGAAKVAADVQLGGLERARRQVGALEARAEAVVDRDEGGRTVGGGDDVVAGFGDVDLGAGDAGGGGGGGVVGVFVVVDGLGLEALGGGAAVEEGLAVGGAVEGGIGGAVDGPVGVAGSRGVGHGGAGAAARDAAAAAAAADGEADGVVRDDVVALDEVSQRLADLEALVVVAAVRAAAPAAPDLDGAGGAGELGGILTSSALLAGVLALFFQQLLGALALEAGPGAQVVFKYVLSVVVVTAHDEELAVVDVAQVLEVLDAEVVPLHQEDAGHEAVGDWGCSSHVSVWVPWSAHAGSRGDGEVTQYADAGKVVLAKLAPQALVEAADAVIGVGGALAVGNAVEEVAVVGALLPHALHLGAAGLEVAKVLLAKARLLVDLDVVALEGARLRVVAGQGGQDALGGLAGAAVGAREEVQGVVGAQHAAQAAAGLVGLLPAILGELDAVVGDGLVDVAVFCKTGSLLVGGKGGGGEREGAARRRRGIREESRLDMTYCCPRTGRGARG